MEVSEIAGWTYQLAVWFYTYGWYVVWIGGFFGGFGMLKCCFWCCSCRKEEEESESATTTVAVTHPTTSNTTVERIQYVDKYGCSIGAVLAVVLPIAIFFMAVAIRADYYEHYEECQQSVFADWNKAHKLYCKFCTTHEEHAYYPECVNARRVVTSVRYYDIDSFHPCDPTSYELHLAHNYTACAYRKVLSHAYTESTTDAPDSFRTVTWIRTMSNSTEYIAMSMLVLSLAILAYYITIPCAFSRRAKKASAKLQQLNAQRQHTAKQLTHVDSFTTRAAETEGYQYITDGFTQQRNNEIVDVVFPTLPPPRVDRKQVDVERVRSDPHHFPAFD